MSTVHATTWTFAALLERASAMAATGERVILGITGAPGAGKSTLAEWLVQQLGPDLAVLVPMDGFHLADDVLIHKGTRPRKGAHVTFDAWGYINLLRRIQSQRHLATEGREGTIYAPTFRRDLEEPIGSSIRVPTSVPLVVTEGNYLLLEEHPWPQAREALSEVWFLAPTEEQRLAQLISRHEQFGRSPEEARERSLGSDQQNAELITATASRADLIVRLADRL